MIDKKSSIFQAFKLIEYVNIKYSFARDAELARSYVS